MEAPVIAAETLALLLGRSPHRPGLFDSVGVSGDVYEVDLGTAENLDTVTLSRGRDEVAVRLPEDRPAGPTYLSIDAGSGRVTTVVNGTVIYRSPPDQKVVHLFETPCRAGLSRQETAALAGASRRIAAEVNSRALFDRGPLLFDHDGELQVVDGHEDIRRRIIAAMERSEREYMEKRIAEGGWPYTGVGLDWYAVFGGRR